jgi:DNA (cytosine-5)-methyltransferase 1
LERGRSKKIRSLAWVVVRWAKAVRPRVICLENVEEFLTWGPLDKEGQPIQEKAGVTWRAWCSALRRIGYVVDWCVLDASKYGAPTKRKRLFVVARCDGVAIRWPAPTHGPGLLPFRTAGECIDWSIPTRSIFGRKRPLADKTMHRIAEGIRRFVIENPRPYIVRVNHGRDDWRGQTTEEPLTTVEASRRGHALVAPHLVKWRHDSAGASLSEPAPTVTSGGNAGGRPAGAAHALGLAAPYLVNTRNGERIGQKPRVRSLDEPAPTVTAKGSQGALVAPVLVEPGQRHGGGNKPADVPLGTIVAKDRHAVAEVALVDMQRDNAPRSLDEPLGVVTTQHNRFNLLRAAFVAKHFGGVYGQKPDEPIGTVTARDHHGPVLANLVKLRGECNGASLDEPMPTITAQGLHLAECRAFLTKFYSAKGTKGASLFDPAPTATAKARFGLVVVDGVEYEIGDIFLRMLEPEELLRAQFGEFAADYDLSAATTKEAKTRLIGNSVAPHVAAALVRANLPICELRKAVGA